MNSEFYTKYHCPQSITTVKLKVFNIIWFLKTCLIYKPYIQQNTGRWVPNTIPLSYMLVNAGRRITSIPLVVDLRDRYIWQNTYYGGQQVELCEVSEEFLCHYHPHKTAMDVLMECQFSQIFNEWEYQRQKLTWRQTAPGMGES